MARTFDLNAFIADVTATLEREALLTDLAEYLCELLGDGECLAAFVRDPEGELAGRGFGDITPGDVRDARRQLIEQRRALERSAVVELISNDPVREIDFTAAHYVLNHY